MMLDQQPPELFPERPVRSDFNAAGPSYRMRRITSIIVLIAVAGGGMYLAFAHSSHPTDPASVPTIKAETAYKERPEQPGGIDIPHQDVDVYKELGNDDAAKETAEHIMPAAEVPQPIPGEAKAPMLEAPPIAVPNTVESMFDTTPSTPAEPAAAATEKAVVEKAAAVEVKAHEIPTTVSQTPKPAAVVEKKVDDVKPVTAELPKAIKQAVIAPKPPEAAKPVVVSNINKPAAPVVEASSKTEAAAKAGPVVQLAASTDQAAAQKMLGDFETKYASALDGVSLHLVRADLGAKGVYYRVQTESVSADHAGRVCAALKKMNAGCFVVR